MTEAELRREYAALRQLLAQLDDERERVRDRVMMLEAALGLQVRDKAPSDK